jgi:prolyl-tRNA synthetase
MSKENQKAITKRSEDQSKWYTEVVQRAELADYSPVRGCMVIRPYGYAIWENIQRELDKMIKAAGVKNAYFPIFIPYSFLQKEAEHVEGFAPEVAVVTHAGGEELEEKLVVRPTSETMIYEMFSQWIESYRDLPLKINQWANVVRWEKRTTPFLRTTEFLWQEGHTAHATKEEAEQEVMRALDMYQDLVTNVLAMDVIKGYKTEKEKFAGAEYTTTIEGLMKDGKALQSGTSHLLSENFVKSFNVKYAAEDGSEKFVYTTSWGLSTRVIGGLILQHGDDKGLVLPPSVAPVQVGIVPIFQSDNKAKIEQYIAGITKLIETTGLSYEVDWSENSPGFKFSQTEMKGIPVRLEVGPKDMEKEKVTAVMRTSGDKDEISVDDLPQKLQEKMQIVQDDILNSARKFREGHTQRVESYDDFKKATEGEMGFIEAFFCGDAALEKQIQEETKYTTRCIPFDTYDQEGKCILSGKPGKLTLFARAY